MTETIYRVTTEGDVEGRSTRTLGYCTGSIADIKAYFDDKKYYYIYVEQIKVLHISATDSKEKKELLERKKRLEAELKSLNDRIG